MTQRLLKRKFLKDQLDQILREAAYAREHSSEFELPSQLLFKVRDMDPYDGE